MKYILKQICLENANLVGAYNMLITPSPMDRGNGPGLRPRIEPRGDVILNLPALGNLPFMAGRVSAFRRTDFWR